MARPPVETDPADTFIREVDEEYRRDRLAQFWARYGRWLLIGIGIGLVALAGYLYWREERAKAAGAFGAEFSQTLERLEAGNTAGAKPELEKAAAAPQPGYEALGRLALAAVAADEGRTEEAVRRYAAIAADDGMAVPFREAATVKQTMLQFDTLTTAQIAARLQPLTQAGSPWLGTAGEMLAAAYMRDGKPALAAPIFLRIAREPTVPGSIRARATQMASMLGVNALPEAPAAPAAVAPAKAD